MDIWTIITGLASIVAFVFSLPEKYSSWRIYIIPIAWASLGYAIGRMHVLLAPSINPAFEDPTLIGIIAILIIGFSVLYYAMKTIKGVSNGFFGLLIILMFFSIEGITKNFLDTKHQISAPELIEFASFKESRGDYSMAAHYLSLAESSIKNIDQKKTLDAKILELSKRQLESPGTAHRER